MMYRKINTIFKKIVRVGYDFGNRLVVTFSLPVNFNNEMCLLLLEEANDPILTNLLYAEDLLAF